jgi:hypothetical protein
MKSLLFFLVGLTGIISLMGGLQMIHSPNGEVLNMSLIPLEQTPFKNFLIPGLFLAIVVGGVSFVALVLQIQLHPARFNWAIAAGILLSFWIIVQIFFLGQSHWWHYIYLFISLLIISVAIRLKETIQNMKK